MKRYFKVIQNVQTRILHNDKKVDVAELAKTAKEITEEQAKQPAWWGSGHVCVYETGDWKWENTNFDSSG